MRRDRIAIYPGSFDPLTNGHIDLISRSLFFFDRVIVGIGINSKKKPMLSFDERKNLIYKSLVERLGRSESASEYQVGGTYITIESFDNLVVEFAQKHKARAIIRGLRNNPDFEAEFAFAHINTRMAPEIEHVYFMASEADHFVSSSVVKELWQFGQGYKSMVPQSVFECLETKRG